MQIVCQSCNKSRATVHLTDVSQSGEAVERHLCEECAAQQGFEIKTAVTTTAVLQEFLKQSAGLTTADELKCPECGMTVLDFQKKGVLGCPNDYETFEPVLSQLIERAHEGATHHVGKVPKSAGEQARRLTELRRMRRELQEAVDREDYERASKLKDEIDSLEAART